MLSKYLWTRQISIIINIKSQIWENNPWWCQNTSKYSKMHQSFIYQGFHTHSSIRYFMRYKRIKIGIYSQIKGTSPAQLKYWQANRCLHLFGKTFKIYFKYQKVKYRNIRGKERENLYFGLLWISSCGTQNLLPRFRKEKRLLYVFPKLFICICM